MTTKDIGDIGERFAAKHLKKCGYKIKGRNRHFSHNELDIIAEDKKYIVFVEVKTRSVSSDDKIDQTSPASAVTYSKQSRLITAANDYIRSTHTLKQPRMDVIEIWINKETRKLIKINHIQDAYGV